MKRKKQTKLRIMQSLRRQIKRGNAVIVKNTVTNQMEVITKKGTQRKIWNRSKRERSIEFEEMYDLRIVQPLKSERV